MTKLTDEFIKQCIVDGNRRLLLGDGKLLIKSCEIAQAKMIIEVGSFDGGSTNILGTWAKENCAHLITMEPKPTAKWKANICNYDIDNHVRLKQEASPLSFSHIPSIDVLFIDGDHRTSHTICDFIAGAPLLKVGGVYVQHDWCGRPSKQYQNRSVKDMVRRAIDIIMEDYGDCFEECGRSEGSDRGAIAFKKTKEMRCNIK